MQDFKEKIAKYGKMPCEIRSHLTVYVVEDEKRNRFDLNMEKFLKKH